MKAAELRVGNYVYNETIREVMEVYPMMIPQMKRCELAGEHNIKPIPLTEEWLIKFGFKDLRHSGEQLFELIHNDIIGYRFSMEGQYGYPEIKYVHQLQNLFFALTGEELKEPSNEPAATQR